MTRCQCTVKYPFGSIRTYLPSAPLARLPPHQLPDFTSSHPRIAIPVILNSDLRSQPKYDIQPSLTLLTRRKRIVQTRPEPPSLRRPSQRQHTRYFGKPRPKRRTGEKLVLQTTHDVIWRGLGRPRHDRDGSPARGFGRERAVPPFMRRTFDLPGDLRCVRVRIRTSDVWWDALRAIWTYAITGITCSKTSAEPLGKRRQKEGVQFEGRLFDEA